MLPRTFSTNGALPVLAAGILFTAVDLARCDCVAQGAQASRGFGAAVNERRSAAARMVLVLLSELLLLWVLERADSRRKRCVSRTTVFETPRGHAD